MKVGDKVKIKGMDEEGTIICVYAVPKDWDLIDVQFNDGQIMRGVSTENVSLIQKNVSK